MTYLEVQKARNINYVERMVDKALLTPQEGREEIAAIESGAEGRRTRRMNEELVEACMRDARGYRNVLPWRAIEYWTDRIQDLMYREGNNVVVEKPLSS